MEHLILKMSKPKHITLSKKEKQSPSEWVGALSSKAKCCHLHPEVRQCLSSLQRVSLDLLY